MTVRQDSHRHRRGIGSRHRADALRSSLDEEENDAAREARHTVMAWHNSLTMVVTGMWEKAKRPRHR
ncbi:hypothetical protein QYE76_047903 [Lolium multiflorum]|uniref:Uncharacterized protein n=1 Tax=Lolium multiflorum TaxID=4521 RepID=A0AAD8TQR2_LOLMU|nr:hypothetical protein QYE76_047903 [Lolium multiflorum]